MFTRKSMFVALTVIAMLAMLVPVAVAAPEVLSGIAITAPTTAAWKLVSPPADVTVNYTVTITGQQVNDVVVTAYLLDDYGVQWATNWERLNSKGLVNGANADSIVLKVLANTPEGWYNVKVCAVEQNEQGGIISDPCTTQTHAVRVDKTPPAVTLERPARVEGCAWVTGQQYELFGMATDNVEVKNAWFQYSASGNTDDAIVIGNENANKEGQNATPVAGFPGEFRALWDSSLVPDGPGFIRFCAVDTAGHEACTDWASVCIENRVKIDLQKGWNLISTPLLLYNSNIDDVMKHVWNPLTGEPWASTPIDMVYTTRDGGATWTFWKNGAPDGVKTIQDGFGYWVHTVAPAQIEFVGTWLSIGPVAPPEYAVRTGWNLIGYTHWGNPTMGPWKEVNQSVAEYLGWPMVMSVESMYRYDAAAGHYIPVFALGGTGEQTMKQGAGYWLALSEGGTINP